MVTSKTGKLPFQKAAIDEDIKFLMSIMSDRIAQYTSLDVGYTKRMVKMEERKKRDNRNAMKRKNEEEVRKEESERVIDTEALDQLLGQEDEGQLAGLSNKT